MKRIHFALDTLSRYLRIIVSSIISHIKLKLIGVKIGKRTIFDGVPRVLHQPGDTSIVIGSNCKFNSSPNSNLIGINRRCILSTHLNKGKITIGDRCGFSATSIAAFEQVTIGNGVRVGANAVITDSDWHLDDPRAGASSPVTINDNVWLGYGVIVLKGVTIGENSVIGAGSVVVSDIPANVIAAGNPCRVIKSLKNN